MLYAYIAAVTAASMIITKVFLNNILRMLCRTENGICSATNYRGEAIPAIGGIFFIPVILLAVFLLVLRGQEYSYSYLSYLVLVLTMGFTGVLDDLIGERKTKGLINHFRSTLKGSMTTGFLKAFSGFIASCIISVRISDTYTVFILNTLIISLCTNTLNIFDLRPGRAVKVFLAAAVILVATAAETLAEAAPVIILILAAWLYIPYDLREICMLGDTGANILGVSLGYYSAILLDVRVKVPILAFIVLLNIASEKYSITEIINKNKLLSYIDSIGRRQAGN